MERSRLVLKNVYTVQLIAIILQLSGCVTGLFLWMGVSFAFFQDLGMLAFAMSSLKGRCEEQAH